MLEAQSVQLGALPWKIWQADAVVSRAGDFESLGLLSHEQPRMLVSYFDTRWAEDLARNSNISCVLTTPELAPKVLGRLATVGVVTVRDPKSAFYQLHAHLAATDFFWKPFPTEIAPDATVHPRAYVAPTDVRIGPGSVIEANANVLERSILGRNVVIRTGAVIGGEDLEAKLVAEKFVIVAHAGGVELEDNVEVQSNAVVMRSVHGGRTVVGTESKVGALAHVAHSSRIGKRCFIGPCVLVGGSSIIGDDVRIAPNATISSEIRVGDGAHVTLGAVVTRDVPAGARVSGNFAIDHDRFISFVKAIR